MAASRWLVVAVGPEYPTVIDASGKDVAAALQDAYPLFPPRTAGAWVFRKGRLAGLYRVRRGKAHRIHIRGEKKNPSPAGGRVPRKEWRAFRTGMTYQDVYEMLWTDSKDSAEWKYKSRGVVLGMWHRIKLELWNYAQDRANEGRPAVLAIEGREAGADLDDTLHALKGARALELPDAPF